MDADEKKFDHIVGTYNRLIRRLCWQRSWNDESLCMELMQDVYITVWRRLHTLNSPAGKGREIAWVITQCRSVFSHRSRRRRPEYVEIDERIADTTMWTDGSEAAEVIADLSQGLTGHERQVLGLIIEGFSPEEIGQRLGIKTGSVRILKHRIIMKMRKNHKDHE